MALFTATTYLIEYHPYQHRNECCAVGVLVIKADQTANVYAANNLKKAKSLNPACSIETLRDGLHAIAADINKNPNLLELYQSGFGLLKICPKAGYIQYSTTEEYDKSITWALSIGVNPAIAIYHRERATTSKLFLEIKHSLNAFGWIAKVGQGINDHRIISRYCLPMDEGLNVDFALKNSTMHLMQTADFRTGNASSKRIEVQSKLMSFAIAPSYFEQTNKSLIIAGGNEPEAYKTIRLAERMADNIYVKESSEDMTRLFNAISIAMGQEIMPRLTFN